MYNCYTTNRNLNMAPVYALWTTFSRRKNVPPPPGLGHVTHFYPGLTPLG